MLFIGTDHKGFALKESLNKYLLSKSIPFTDLGNFKLDKKDDYPVAAALVAEQVKKGKNNIGILICGSGIGVTIAANKFKGIRAGLVWTPKVAQAAKADDNINILCLPADYLSINEAQKIIDIWLKTSFKKEKKYKRRLGQIERMGYPVHFV